MTPFTLQIPKDIEARLRKCRASIRVTIRKRLQDILETAPQPRALPSPKADGPALRFYVFEGYRISYRVNALTRKVVVLTMQAESD